ncbi:asialoglycoprotein receptor 1-like isoform X2 [Phycodurus eques]|uniref:asialoglycoprotein receptor 1-like isoform X2 n=1 Tax=Phycodurus eques TaxID=693459 RepID=UPI002ACDA948|nr:asialoglycoprotein receptor 1-like isoform X2 [Phycodurus eques]
MPIGGPECGSDRMFSKLIEDDEELDPSPDVHMPGDPAMRPTIKVTGPYRMATIGLATLCGVLLVAIIAVTAHYKNKAAGGAAAEAQMQTADVDALNAVISQLRREKDDLQKKLDARTTVAASNGACVQAAGPRAATSPASPASPVVCPPDWLFFNSSCYFISEVSRNWPVSRAHCESEGAHLAVILAADEQLLGGRRAQQPHRRGLRLHGEDARAGAGGAAQLVRRPLRHVPPLHLREGAGRRPRRSLTSSTSQPNWTKIIK